MMELRAALILHESGQQINENNVKKVLESAGAQVDEAKVKALVVSLEGVNIDEALKESVSFAAPTAPVAGTEKKEEKKDEEEESKRAEEAAAGLSSLFG